MLLLPLLAAACFNTCSLPPKLPPLADHSVVVSDFDETSLAPVYKKLDELENDGAKKITLKIVSHGGKVEQGWEFVNRVEDLRKGGAKVTCIVENRAYSFGAILLESPACQYRYATRRSNILIHLAKANIADGPQTEADLAESMKFLGAVDNGMLVTLAERMKTTPAALKAKVWGRDWILSADEALAENALDGLIDPMDVPPAYKLDKADEDGKSLIKKLLGI